MTQSGVPCTRFQGQEKLALPKPSQSEGGRGRLSLEANRRSGAGGEGGAGQAEGEWQEPRAVGEQDVRPLGAARANGCGRWAGREVSVLGLRDWERGSGSRAGPGGVCAARKCTRMPPLSVSSGGAGPGWAARCRLPAHWRPPPPPAWPLRHRVGGGSSCPSARRLSRTRRRGSR